MKQASSIIRVVVPSPLWRAFDYLCEPAVQCGMRVKVPFGRRQVVGVVVAIAVSSDFPQDKLKSVSAVLDVKPLLNETVLKLAQWASDYYHYPIGEVVVGTLPKMLRLGKSPEVEKYYVITEAGRDTLISGVKRAPKQGELLQKMAAQVEPTARSQLMQWSNAATLKALINKAYIQLEVSTLPQESNNAELKINPGLVLNPMQQQAVDSINQQQGFNAHLLLGVTGSGKTEVYFQAMASVIEAGKQVLFLVPEISLTPQTVARFKARFNLEIVLLHSELSDGERMRAWMQAVSGEAKIIIGTRSAIFVGARNLGMIILDEEHDTSFKQQAGFRYSARDLAMVRGRLENVPVILGTATPSLESLQNVQSGKYQLLSLPERAGSAKPPRVELIDLRGKDLRAGLSAPLLAKMHEHLARQGQVLLFLNRRGYAPVLLCHDCAQVVHCSRCDAKMTLHQRPRRLFCHHCDSTRPIPGECEHCHSKNLISLGLGTEQLETETQQLFPGKKILRIDRDTVRGKKGMENMLANVHGGADILIGTQMLAKGHHFPRLTLVAIVDADSGLFSLDFRALERLSQLLVQVAGRSGRGETAGEVLIQTHQPEHPQLQLLLQQGYLAFAENALQERQQAYLPPFIQFALLRAESVDAALPRDFLQQVKQQLEAELTADLRCFGPIAAPMERKAGRYRAQLLFQGKQRAALRQLLKNMVSRLSQQKGMKKVRWSLDVDPIDMG